MASEAALREYYIEQMHERGFATAEFQLDQTSMSGLFEDLSVVFDDVFDRVTPAGQDIVDALNVQVKGRPADSKGFIERRRVGQPSMYEINRGPGTDNKDQFHYTPQTFRHAIDHFRGKGGTPMILGSLLTRCEAYHQAVKSGVRPVIKLLGLDEHLFAPEDRDSDNVHVSRFLIYPALEEELNDLDLQRLISKGEVIGDRAELHFDRGRFTAATVETEPGLVGVKANNHIGNPGLSIEELDAFAQAALLTEVRHEPGRMKIFPSAGINHLPVDLRQASGNLDPFLHGVVNRDTGKVRKAAVTFINEHALVTGWPTPSRFETGFGQIRGALVERQRRFGAVAEN